MRRSLRGIAVATAIASALTVATVAAASGSDLFRAQKIALLQKEAQDAASRLSGPRLSAEQQSDPDPAGRLALSPHPRMVYWNAPCPSGPCEHLVPPTHEEGVTIKTNNYYIGFDGRTAFTIFAGSLIADGRGFLRYAGAGQPVDIVLAPGDGVPTLLSVAGGKARFTTSSGRSGSLDLATLAVSFN